MAAMDRTMLQLLQQAFRDLGFEADESELRAKILYYVGVGFVHVGPLGTASAVSEQLSAVFALLTRPA